MEKIIEKFLNDKNVEKEDLKTIALSNIELGVPWNGA